MFMLNHVLAVKEWVAAVTAAEEGFVPVVAELGVTTVR
jgi:hypothetical protein